MQCEESIPLVFLIANIKLPYLCCDGHSKPYKKGY